MASSTASITGKFDLNMEEVLEAWKPSDAVRELIANALDEHSLIGTDEPEIYQDIDGRWHIRDHGRGLRYQHLTQSENDEKLNNPDKVIGKFGVGLKDALATLYRHDIEVTIHSKHNTFTVEEAPKHGFDQISTLHVNVGAPARDIDGTDVVLDGVTGDTIEKAKQNFIRFSDVECLESTRFGEVYTIPVEEKASVYVTGLKVATEENFLFSYNITNTTKPIRDALNRERTNVGRTAYTSRVKRILKDCNSEAVAEKLVDDLQQFTGGDTHDELGWKPIQVHAVKTLNAKKDVVVATMDEQNHNRDLIDSAKADNYQVVTIPDRIRDEIADTTDTEGNQIRNIAVYTQEYEESFTFDWIDEDSLNDDEQAVWALKDAISTLADLPNDYRIQLSKELRATDSTKTLGICQAGKRRIIIKRSALQSRTEFIGTLLHEIAHTRTPFPDQTREFESELTNLLGIIGAEAVSN